MDVEQHDEDERPGAETNVTGGEEAAAEGEELVLAEHGAAEGAEDVEETPLVRVRYGLGKELRLYPDAIVVALLEAHEETRYALDGIRRLILVPGEYTPSKLVVMFELDDGNTVIAADGMTNARGFRQLLTQLREIAPQIELDPDNMDEQLAQALDIRRRYSLGCYGVVIGACLLLWIFYLVVALIGHGHH
jgi:hypothetical protein